MIKFKSKLEKYKTLKGRNNAFDRLNDEEKRKEIAWDALKLLTKGVIGAKSGTYWAGDLKHIKRNSKNPKEFQEKLCSIKKKDNCKVCARGALMLSQIRLGNSISPRSNYAEKGCYYILKGFDFNSFKDMESTFEGWADSIYEEGSNENLANILCNVITNGDFDENDGTDYVQKHKIKV